MNNLALDWDDSSEKADLAAVIARINKHYDNDEQLTEGTGGDTNPATDQQEKIGKPLPRWPEVCAAIPTELTRASLFRLIRRGRRKIMNWEIVASRTDVQARYFGEQLDQADADLWLACLRLGRGVPMGQRIYTTRARLLREIGRCDTGPNRKWLDSALDRFTGAGLRVEVSRRGQRVIARCKFMSSGIEELSGQMYIRLDPEGAALFENIAYIGWEQRLALGSNAAKALQLYVSGHQAGKLHTVPLADLARWMGYEGRLRQFRASLQEAMDELSKGGLIHSYGIKIGPRGDIAYWARTSGALPATPL